MAATVHAATYWDASAILSALTTDAHSDEAHTEAKKGGTHVLSSLAWAETLAVLARMQREGTLTNAASETAHAVLSTGPWRPVAIAPRWKAVRGLAAAWQLKGADLWHLAAAKHLQEELPELRLLSFNARLRAAAQGEGLV